ncbi:YcnI family copper-binding membrane protein [Paenibacillus cymbidii]|uniref:YcnI family copper-binding membrane protein n=1 Tax=Paenibacillus cymbidii TaxID=1639034 RepID=UPI0010818F32|nr:YcnI family protein [Paenibacillus cymbidii]
MNRKKWLGSLVFALLLAFSVAGAASAHVTVFPQETTQGTYEKFTVRVPSEKESPTVKVEVKFATDDVAVSRFEPKPGWKYDIVKSGDKITGVVWTATGDGLLATEFGEFNMQGKVADTAKDIAWKAYQTYKDGTVVEWTGASDSKTPASVTKVKAKPTGGATDSHGNAVAGGGDAGESSTSDLPLYLSIAALVLGAAALLAALTRKAK